MVTEEPPPNSVLAGAADFGRCSLRRERQSHEVASPSGTRVHLVGELVTSGEKDMLYY